MFAKKGGRGQNARGKGQAGTVTQFFASFIAEHCEIGDGFRVATVDFVDAFNSAMGERWSSTKMGAKMQDKGFEKKKARVGSGSTQCFIGIQRVLVDLDPM